MTFQTHICRCVAMAAAIVVIGSSALTARAAPAESAGGIGSVDIQRCVNESKARTASEQQWRDYGQTLDEALQHLAAGSDRLLTEAEIRELADLSIKPQPTQADTDRRKALEAKADLSGAELSRLQQVAAPTDAEKKRFDELTASRDKGEQVLQSVRDDYKAKVETRRDELLQKLTKLVRDEVGKVASQKGLAVVYDSLYAVYTRNDITAEVIKSLNK